MLEEGYDKGFSDNLPYVDYEMVDEFYRNMVTVEERNVKTKRSARPAYGDQAVAYVHLKRTNGVCTVKAKITPEHKVHATYYNVCAEINEADNSIISCKCLSCAASEGHCKHAVAFLFWLLRRSDEPSVTSRECYWKRSKLSEVGKNVKGKLGTLVTKDIPPIKKKGNEFLYSMICACPHAEGGIFSLEKLPEFSELSLYQSVLQHNTENDEDHKKPDNFLQFMSNRLTEELCKNIEIRTRSQASSPLWHEMRFGRITASKIYEVSRCKTTDGSLIEVLLGARKVRFTEAMERGQILEEDVLKEVMKKKQIKKYYRSGIILSNFYPYFGASPDGLTTEYAVEIKCPSKEKTVKNYVKDGVIQPKYLAQVQLQMFITKRKKGLFCVASPKFETTKEVAIYDVDLDEDLCKYYLDTALLFWKEVIYPKLKNI